MGRLYSLADESFPKITLAFPSFTVESEGHVRRGCVNPRALQHPPLLPPLYFVYVLWADDIDIALLRRFHSRIFVGPPSHKDRVDMIVGFMGGIENSLDDKQLTSLAERISGWSGSDIKVCLKKKGVPVEQRGGSGERAIDN